MRRGSRTVVLALVLIGLGMFLLLRNTGAISEDVRIWPFVLVGGGGYLLADRILNPSWYQGGFFVPLVLLAVGGVPMLQDLGVLDPDLEVWPVILIALGLALVLEAPSWRRAPTTTETVPLEGATAADVRIEHGGGTLRVHALDQPGTLLTGTFEGGADTHVERTGGRAAVRLRGPAPWRGWRPGRNDWTVGIARDVPLTLTVKGGASKNELDLESVRATDISIETGASDTVLTVPAAGRSKVRVRGGAAHVRIRVPKGVAAAIDTRGGASRIEVDTGRFPRFEGGYRSPEYERAAAVVDLDIDVGAAGVEIE